jgi:hypothetical protein
MSATTDEPDDSSSDEGVVPDVTRTPLRELDFPGDSVLDAAVRRLIEDVVQEGEITAGFGNIP